MKLKRGSSYVKSPKWVSDKKATINPQNFEDNFCLAYSIIAALHHQDITNNPERITKLRPYINNYNWKNLYFPAGPNEYKKIECNNKDVAPNILSVPYGKSLFLNIIYKL